MTLDADNIAIESRFETQWGLTTPVAYMNVEFDPPRGSPWVRLSVLPGGEGQIELGNPSLDRHVGIIDVSIFTPEGKGTKQARELAEQAAAVFRKASFSGILCRNPDVTTVGVMDGWHQITVRVPYQRDTIN